MNAVNEAIFAIGEKYLGKDGRTMRNYGVSLKTFVNWYLQEYQEGNMPGCSALQSYMYEKTDLPKVLWPTDAFDAILNELFPQKSGKHPKATLREWMKECLFFHTKILRPKDERLARLEYMEKLLKREDRILVCPCYWCE